MKYFFSYAWPEATGLHLGWCDVEVTGPICTGEDLQVVVRHLKERFGVQDLTILSWRRFEEPLAGAGK